MNTYFNPGCALSVYKPETEGVLLRLLRERYGEVEPHKICCHHEPNVEKGSLIINVCAGCDRRFSTLYDGVSTISLWEVIDGLGAFEYPDYNGLQMSIHDPCPIRGKPRVHKAVRNLLKKMNIETVETAFHGETSVCCGDSFYPSLPVDEVNEKMKERAASMPCENVAVYCDSCVKSMHIGGKTPRHLIDLLLGEETFPQVYETEAWHRQVKEYRDAH
jgi:Fe-S oxidoreductase